nr:retrovirus-related Pol polyprotein from transposon TNT 1-94 [Tanacetum cinerariifolium]
MGCHREWNSFKPVAQTTTDDAGTSTTLIPGPITTEEKAQKKNDVNARSTSSTNEVNTAYGVSTTNTQANPASTQVNTASTQVSAANLSDVTVQPRNQDSRNWNQDSSRRTVNVEETPPKAMVAIDGVGFDWSYMVKDELNLSNSGLEKFQQPEFKGYGPKTSKNVSEEIPNEVKESPATPLVKDRVSDSKDCSVDSPVVLQYAIKLSKKHGMYDCVSMSTPMATKILNADLQGTPTDQTTYRRIIGGIMYPITCRPNIAFATLDSGFELIAYSDADHAGCKDDCKSTSGGLQFLGKKLVSWSFKKQDCTAMSKAEAKYVSMSACCAQVIWMGTQLLDYGYKYNKMPMYCHSKSAIAISCNSVQHSRTKHINIQSHFIKEHVEKRTVKLYFIETEYQLADLFTKALPKERFEYLVHRIGMR